MRASDRISELPDRHLSDAIVLGLVSFPVLAQALSMIGFACGMPIGHWQAPIAFAGAMALAFWQGCGRRRCVCWTAGIIALSIALSGMFLLFSYADGEAYHRPALVLLANGWNPLRTTEVADIETLMGGGFSPWQVAFVPRMGWTFGASLYKLFGFIEVADSLNVMLFIASVLAVRRLLVSWSCLRFVWFWTIIVCISPVVARSIWGGMVDSAMYSLFLIVASYADREKQPQLIIATVAMASLKVTGCVLGAIIFAVYACRSVPDWTKFRRWVICGTVAGLAILLVNASPYLTSIKNHGGPFYPQHSFVQSERFDEADVPITAIFHTMNDDARELGYFGRFAWAYVSQDLVKAYYRKKTGRAEFNPAFAVSGGVGGFGTVFRVFFLVSLVVLPFIRNSRILLLMGIVLASVIIQPTFYSGYVRYVPQFYAFPLLAMLGIWQRFERSQNIAVSCAVGGCGVVYALALISYQLGYLALQWIVSVQNIQIVEAGQRNDVVVSSEYLATRYALTHDCFMKVVETRAERSSERKEQGGVGSFFDFYRCYFNGNEPDVYGAAYSSVGNDSERRATRDNEMMSFFMKEFLPREIVRLPLRLWQVVRLRCRQMIH